MRYLPYKHLLLPADLVEALSPGHEARLNFGLLLDLLRRFPAQNWLLELGRHVESPDEHLTPVEAVLLDRKAEYFATQSHSLMALAHHALRSAPVAPSDFAPSIKAIRSATSLYHSSNTRYQEVEDDKPEGLFYLLVPMIYEQNAYPFDRRHVMARAELLYADFEYVIRERMGMTIAQLLRLSAEIAIRCRRGRRASGGLMRKSELRGLDPKIIERFLAHLSATPSSYREWCDRVLKGHRANEFNALRRFPFIRLNGEYIVCPFSDAAVRIATDGLRHLILELLPSRKREAYLAQMGSAFQRYVLELVRQTFEVHDLDTDCDPSDTRADGYFESGGLTVIIESKVGVFARDAIPTGSVNLLREFLERRIPHGIEQVESTARRLGITNTDQRIGIIVTEEWIPLANAEESPFPLPENMCVLPVDELEFLCSLGEEGAIRALRTFFDLQRPDRYFCNLRTEHRGLLERYERFGRSLFDESELVPLP